MSKLSLVMSLACGLSLSTVLLLGGCGGSNNSSTLFPPSATPAMTPTPVRPTPRPTTSTPQPTPTPVAAAPLSLVFSQLQGTNLTPPPGGAIQWQLQSATITPIAQQLRLDVGFIAPLSGAGGASNASRKFSFSILVPSLTAGTTVKLSNNLDYQELRNSSLNGDYDWLATGGTLLIDKVSASNYHFRLLNVTMYPNTFVNPQPASGTFTLNGEGIATR